MQKTCVEKALLACRIGFCVYLNCCGFDEISKHLHTNSEWGIALLNNSVFHFQS